VYTESSDNACADVCIPGERLAVVRSPAENKLNVALVTEEQISLKHLRNTSIACTPKVYF